jgi:hypothetical protein
LRNASAAFSASIVLSGDRDEAKNRFHEPNAFTPGKNKTDGKSITSHACTEIDQCTPGREQRAKTPQNLPNRQNRPTSGPRVARHSVRVSGQSL